MSYTHQTYPFIISKKKYGDIFIGQTKELIIFREQKNFYRSIPCNKHKGFCAGFTLWSGAVMTALRQGVKVLKVNFKANKHATHLDTFVCNLEVFSKYPQTLDDKKKLQNSMPLHDFTELKQ